MTEKEAPKAQDTGLAKLEQADYSEMERRDETQIAKQLQGEVVEEWVYEVKGVPCLSYVGIKEVQRRSGHIKLSDPMILETDAEFRVLVKATDDVNHIEHFGISRALKTMQTRDGPKDDEFALQKAMSKAQRNAIRNVVPERTIAMLLSEWTQQKGGGRPTRRSEQRQPTTPGGNPVPDAPLTNPGPAPAPKAKEQTAPSKAAQEWGKKAIDGDFKEGGKAEPAGPEPRATGKQIGYAEKLMGILSAEGRAGVLKARGVAKVDELSKNACSDLIDELEAIAKTAEEPTSAGGQK